MSTQKIEKANGRRQFLKSSIGSAAAVTLPASMTMCGPNEEGAAQSAQGPQGPRYRKNVTSLTAQEKADFTNGILELKRVPSPFFKNNLLSYYDGLVRMHQLAVIQARQQGFGVGHKCPSLLPFHRKLVLLLEDGLRSVTGKDIAVPFWDWTDPSSVATVFADDFMGPATGDPNNDYAVTSGPFKKGDYELNLITVPDGDEDYLNFCPFPFLTRAGTIGDNNQKTNINSQLPLLATVDLPTSLEVNAAMEVPNYDIAPFDPSVDRAQSFRNHLGGWKGPGGAPTLHNVVHTWTGGSWESCSYRYYPGAKTATITNCDGDEKAWPAWITGKRYYVGTMQALQTSANDPVFFIHHANVDRIWAEWQAKEGNGGTDGYPKQGAEGLQAGWGPDDEIAPYAAHKDVPEMTKTGITNASMLDIEKLGYSYEPV
ncbi:MAG: tyrosinase family protein [Cytophagales bacterium]|nr:tyrosinase family protein [Cytophagales bacterium]